MVSEFGFLDSGTAPHPASHCRYQLGLVRSTTLSLQNGGEHKIHHSPHPLNLLTLPSSCERLDNRYFTNHYGAWNKK